MQDFKNQIKDKKCCKMSGVYYLSPTLQEMVSLHFQVSQIEGMDRSQSVQGKLKRKLSQTKKFKTKNYDDSEQNEEKAIYPNDLITWTEFEFDNVNVKIKAHAHANT